MLDGDEWTAVAEGSLAGNTVEQIGAGLSSFSTDGTLTLRAILESSDGIVTPQLDRVTFTVLLR